VISNQLLLHPDRGAGVVAGAEHCVTPVVILELFGAPGLLPEANVGGLALGHIEPGLLAPAGADDLVRRDLHPADKHLALDAVPALHFDVGTGVQVELPLG